MIHTTVAMLAVVASVATVPTYAQDYPNKPVHFITSSPPGGGGDVLVRFVANKVGALSGATIVVENKPGAGGNIATDAVVNAKPDGYTLLLAPSSSVIANKYVIKDTRYDAMRDLAPVSTFLQVGMALVASPKSEAANLKDFVAQLKGMKRPLLYGVPTTSSLLGAQMFLSLTGLEATQVGYKTMGDAASGVTAGELDFAFVDTTLAISQAKNGRLKILAVSPAKRLESAPDLPTIRESGIGEFDFINFWAVWAPAKTPDDVVAKLSGWINQAVEMPDTRDFFLKQGSQAFPGSPSKLTALMKQHDDQWIETAKRAKLEPQ